jgi:hypothetical protein
MSKIKTDKKDDSDRKKITEQAGRMDHRTLAIWAADCAEHVLSYFEDQYPKDNRPRKAIEAGRAWVRGEISVSEARTAAFAAHAAARDSDDPLACAAARAAGHTAATAHVAGHAVHAASYAAAAAPHERDSQYQHLIDLGSKPK